MNRQKRALIDPASEPIEVLLGDGPTAEGMAMQSTEVGSLAREMARAYFSMVDSYRRHNLTPEEAHSRARHSGSIEDTRAWAIENHPDQLSWWALSHLAEHDPEGARVVWERCLTEARAELESGHRAGRALEVIRDPWDRALFLALRQAFIDEWQPVGGIERAMIDTMAQTFSAYLYWLEVLTLRSQAEGRQEQESVKQKGYWNPPAVGDAEALEQAAAMVDRFNRLFLRTLRALRDLRRYSHSVTIENAGQVNIAANGGQQVNTAHT